MHIYQKLATVCVLMTALLWSNVLIAKDKPIRALMITGGCCHEYSTQKRILSDGISARGRPSIPFGPTGQPHRKAP